MIWTIKLSSKAEKYFLSLDKRLRQRIRDSLVKLSEEKNPLNHPQARPLTGELKGFHRLRVGDHRVIFSLINESKTIAVVNIHPRGRAYRGKT